MSLEELLFEARTRQDPVQIHKALSLAEALSPDNLEVHRGLLMLGRLYQRNPRQPDFSLIKCYLFHSFEHPEHHREQALRDMARELFDDERLARCMQLSSDPDSFLRAYLEDLAREYMRIFVAGDTSHFPRVFGMSFKGGMQKYLAVPARDIITNMLCSPFLSPREAVLLARAFYRAYYEHAQGDVSALDELLGAAVCARLGEEIA
jgi:hypothetical protein